LLPAATKTKAVKIMLIIKEANVGSFSADFDQLGFYFLYVAWKRNLRSLSEFILLFIQVVKVALN